MVGENAKVLCEQIEEEKGKITRMFLDEVMEISFWTPAKRRGQVCTTDNLLNNFSTHLPIVP